MTYNKMVEWCERDQQAEGVYRIDTITGHRKTKKGTYDVQVSWSMGETTWEPMWTIFQDDPISVAVYAKDNGLLNTDGWRSCKRYVSNAKKLSRMVNQAKLKSMRNRPVYKYGFQVPRNHREAMKLDEKAGNTMWADAEALEIGQLAAYNTFEDAGLGTPIPDGYTSIPVHLVYDVKHDGRHKARMVTGGHRTSTPVDSVYSGVVTLAGIRTVTFLAELNGLDLWCTSEKRGLMFSSSGHENIII
jgi:hypothetical protein